MPPRLACCAAQCGSCFAFATVGIAEASSAMYTGKVVPGSEQQIIDCDTKHDHGCSGAWHVLVWWVLGWDAICGASASCVCGWGGVVGRSA